MFYELLACIHDVYLTLYMYDGQFVLHADMMYMYMYMQLIILHAQAK